MSLATVGLGSSFLRFGRSVTKFPPFKLCSTFQKKIFVFTFKMLLFSFGSLCYLHKERKKEYIFCSISKIFEITSAILIRVHGYNIFKIINKYIFIPENRICHAFSVAIRPLGISDRKICGCHLIKEEDMM